MGSMMDILAVNNGQGVMDLIAMLLGVDNLGANLFGSLSDAAGGIFGSFDSISFSPEVITPAP
ncbi:MULTISPECIES: hypothetical protein [unclassified Rhodococcus (in: high G+C Gram-positive bacteria)]|uniref:hypothetical protein n=1 Tax=unclassified Rhodococcus (in: high G+C Gram-positive bacteria) TaxID=192944 RepID=UPI000B941791|nr:MULTISPECIES: hypothetical protein [unclassified Rhodococcus (in: high G+C Gram-positive bacteria)]MCJ0902317.1 hypothetical protein [Rhodococcus sp. ARC_M6]OYD68645.1 hypothetical protein BDB13_2199 [Rhodococcus sp. OK302]